MHATAITRTGDIPFPLKTATSSPKAGGEERLRAVWPVPTPLHPTGTRPRPPMFLMSRLPLTVGSRGRFYVLRLVLQVVVPSIHTRTSLYCTEGVRVFVSMNTGGT